MKLKSQIINTEKTDLKKLIRHNNWVEAEQSLREVHEAFNRNKQKFMAVLDQGNLCGVCCSKQINKLTSSVLGQSLHFKLSVGDYLANDFISIQDNEPVTKTLKQAFSRSRDKFYDDIVLTDQSGNYLGMIPVESLVRLQNNYLDQNIDILKNKQKEISQKTQKMEDELLLASKLQQEIMSQQVSDFLNIRKGKFPKVNFFYHYSSLGPVCGDFFHLADLPNNSIGILLCDVMGHGVGSTLVSSMIRTLFEKHSPTFLNPGDLLEKINTDLYKMLYQTSAMIFSTAVYLIINFEEKIISFAKGSHHNPLHLDRHHKKVNILPNYEEGGFPLGMFADSKYAVNEIPFKPHKGDLFMLYTDGLFEVTNSDEIELGQEKLIQMIKNMSEQPTEQIFNQIIEKAKNYSQNKKFEDDICWVGLELN